jgi:hypothetical protein
MKILKSLSINTRALATANVRAHDITAIRTSGDKNMKPESLMAPLRQRLRSLLIVGLSVATFVLVACGGGGGSSSADAGSGEVVIGLTDAEGDFAAYTVDVTSITLIRANGAVVEALPNATRVNFAQYVELTEFISSVTVPSGIYTGARLRLDYTNADVRVEVGGAAVPAIVRDANGQTISTLDLTVQFDSGRALLVAPGVPAHLTLDFNLKLSNQVDTSGATPVVTVAPFLVADVNPEAPKIHRVRGPLQSVNVAASSFQVILRPFNVLTGNFGRLTVATDTNTTFEIDGDDFQGQAGLTQLAAKPFDTATVAIGDLDVPGRRFVAREVYAGSSVPFGVSDVVSGNVVARSGNTLTVRGATLVRADGTMMFGDNVTVQLSSATLVKKQATLSVGLTKDAISVGQRVDVFGTLDVGTMTLDATGGLARMLFTTLTGTVNNAVSGEVQMALQTIDGRHISLYSFGGTGTPGNDADPANYEVSTASLSLAGISTGTPVHVRGFVRPYGQAPNDFDAISVINVAALPALLLTDWQPATATPFTSASASAIVLNLTGTGAVHHVLRGWVVTDLGGTSPRVEPRTGGVNLFAIGYRGTVQVYTRFDLYEQALQVSLTQNRKVRGLAALGGFADATTTLTAARAFTAFE